MVAFNRQVFDGHRRVKVQPAASVEEEENDSGEENDWEQKQAEGLEGEAVLYLRGSLVRHH